MNNYNQKRLTKGQCHGIRTTGTRKLIAILICVAVISSSSLMIVSAENMPVKKIETNSRSYYALRENGDLLHWNEKTNYLPELISSDVVDFRDVSDSVLNGCEYIKSSGELIDQFGKTVATDAKKLNVSYGYVSKNNELKSYDRNNITNIEIIATDVLWENKGMIIKTNGELWFGEKLIMDNAKEFAVTETDRQCWYIIDNQQQLWFISGTQDPKMAVKLISNVKKVVPDMTMLRNFWVITNNDELYWHRPDSTIESGIKPHSSNVKDVKYFADKGIFLLRTNGEFCKVKLEGHPESDIVIATEIEFFTSEYVITDNGVAKVYTAKGVFGEDSSYRWIDLGPIKKILFDSYMTLIYENFSNEVYGFGSTDYLGVGKLSSNNYIGTPMLLPVGLKGTMVMYNGEKVKFTLRSQIRDNRTFYPLRECLDALGATVLWDSETQTATGLLSGKKVEFKIGSNEYKVNGVVKQMDTVAFVDDSIGKTYIPLRYAAEGLGFKIDWKLGDHEDTITISK